MKSQVKKLFFCMLLMFALSLTVLPISLKAETPEVPSDEVTEELPAYTYTIKFNGNGSSSGKMSSIKAKNDTNYQLPSNSFKKKGYSFAGWNTKKDGSGTAYKNKESVKGIADKNNQTITLYAQWKKTKYTITYKLNSGKNNSKNPSSYYITTATITLKNPTRTGYTFSGWYSDSKYKNKVTTIKKGSTGNKTLYAKWTANTYTIKFNGNGSTSGKMSNLKTKYNATPKLTANSFKKKGYSFTGWNTKKDGSGTTYKNKASIKNLTSKNKGTVTLYAQWKKVKYTISYKLNGGKNDSKNPSNYYVTTATITLKNPTRTGYTFSGWYSDSKYKNKVTTIKKGSTGNKTLYAKWKAKVLTASKTSVTVKDKTSIDITFTKINNYYVTYHNHDTSIISCSWANQWSNNVIKLNITALKPGSTYITITNEYNEESIKIKVTVPQYWEDVKVEIPDTIGESVSPGNRMKILNYHFFDEGYKNYYSMNIEFQLVKYGEKGRSNWGENFYCYDAYGNMIDEGYLYAGSLRLGATYRYTALIPKNTAKIEFMEYSDGSTDIPDIPIVPDEGNNPKWKYEQISQFCNYIDRASEYATQAYKYANQARQDRSSFSKSMDLNESLNNMRKTVEHLKKAEEIAKNNPEITFEEGNTLLKEVQETIDIYADINNYQIDTSNASTYTISIYSMATLGKVSCNTLQARGVQMLADFVMQ